MEICRWWEKEREEGDEDNGREREIGGGVKTVKRYGVEGSG